jgi:D-lactate dehydrogenase
VLLSDDPDSYLRALKLTPPVEAEVDRCVECGYCEPICPSRDLTLTPRQRIVLRREIATAEAAGDRGLAAELRGDYEYAGLETCAVDGLCRTSCPVEINTGDLVRRLRAENASPVAAAGWRLAASRWSTATAAGSHALTAAKRAPAPMAVVASRAGRAVLGSENVPLYDARLPAGGTRRSAAAVPASLTDADCVFFAACIGTMFGPEQGSQGSAAAFLTLAARAGITVRTPHGIDSLCCGTPWKSKGYRGGYDAMSAKVLPALLAASDGGRLPIVCDAASCTEGLETMRDAAAPDSAYAALRFVDATQFVHDRVLPRLPPARKAATVVVHHTCSTTVLGASPAVSAIAAAIAEDVIVPVDWGCCAFAGDRGLLHPELTASATAAEAGDLTEIDADFYVSANRTCEIGMTRATGKPYRHILEVLELATR